MLTTEPAEIRPARAGDAAAVLSLWRAAGAEPTHTDNVRSLRQLITHDPGALIVAESPDGLVGSVIAGWDGWRGSIYRLAVVPAHSRRGLGGRLVREAEDRLRSLGAARLQAIVVAGDAAAVSFWRASGWTEQTGRLRFVQG